MIKAYIRKQDGAPHGVVVAIKRNDGEIHYGWSLCSPKDRFNKVIGTQIAVNRAMQNCHKRPDLKDRHATIASAQVSLQERAKKYFK